MSYENLILGVLFSIGIFAAKSGLGIACLVAGQKQKRSKIGAFSLFALSYGLVFAAVVLLPAWIEPVRHPTVIQSWVRSGMIVHLSLAVLLMVWGVLLLKNGHRCRQRSKGWLLALPCPVCVTVIFLAAGFLRACFPGAPKTAVLALFLAFVLIHVLTVTMIGRYRQACSIPSETLLGGAMLLIALYFTVSVAVMPQFDDVGRIYRLARYQGQASGPKIPYLLPFSVLIAVTFAGGFGFKSKIIRRKT